MIEKSNQARLSSTCIGGKTLTFWSPYSLNGQKLHRFFFLIDDTEPYLPFSTGPVMAMLIKIACVASVSVWFRRKRNGIWPRKKWNERRKSHFFARSCVFDSYSSLFAPNIDLWWTFTTKTRLLRSYGSAFCEKIPPEECFLYLFLYVVIYLIICY